MSAYLFYYQMESNSPAEYIWIIEETEKKATSRYNHYIKDIVGDCYFHSLCINVLPKEKFWKLHEVGEILGGNAII